LQQRQLPLLLLGAGLPIIPSLAGNSKSYAERLFNFPNIGALSESDAFKALQEPAKTEGLTFEDAALKKIYQLTKGYPYFLQEWGYLSWNTATTSPITPEIIRSTTTAVMQRLDQNFFRVRFDRLVPSEKTFLRAMAEHGGNGCRISDIANTLQTKTTTISSIRAKLIKKGMIYSPSHGDIMFTVPLFDEFMIRAIPQLPIEQFCHTETT